MKVIFNFLGGRKFTLVIFAAVITLVNPSVDSQELLKVLGIPGLFILVEGVRDIMATLKK